MFSYDPVNPQAKDKVRMLIGDLAENNGVLPGGGNVQDEVIIAFLSEASDNIYKAAGLALMRVVAAWAQFVDTQVGEMRENASKIAERYQKMANDYFKMAERMNDMNARGFPEGQGVTVYMRRGYPNRSDYA